MTQKKYYDVIVVGAGPAGSTAARYAAAGGASVLMLEKDRDIGYPVRCGEAVSHEGIVQFIQPDPKFIASTVTEFLLVAPNGKSVSPRLDGTGYVLERRLFDYEVAKLAADEGAEIITKAYVYDLVKNQDGNACGVQALIKDEKIDYNAKIVIAADGVESRVGRWAGLDTACHIRDMETCAQVTIGGIEIRDNVLELHWGDAVSADGYLWVFPKGKRSANVGIGLSVEAAKEKSAIRYLEEFIERRFPNAAILTRIAGGVPCAKTCRQLVRANVMLVGDAGHQVNPVSGGGIISGMIGGMLAGQTAAEAIQKNDLSFLQEYESRWQKRLGWRHEIYYKIKESIAGYSDEKMNAVCESVLKIPEEKRTLGTIFRAALWNDPGMLLQIAKVFVS